MTKYHFIPLTEKTIVLDLDECLIHSFETKQKKYDFRIKVDEDYYYVVKRNKLDKFINFCFMYFNNVIVWSAGTYNYVHMLVDKIFKNHNNPDLILTRDDIVIDKNTGDYHKPLNIVIDKINIDIKDIYFLDDRKDNFRENPRNGIVIKKFKGKKDDYLSELMNWFLQDNIINSIDVRKLDKKKIWKEKFEERRLIFPSNL